MRTSILKSIIIYRFNNESNSLTFSAPSTNFFASTINSSAIKYVNSSIYAVFEHRSLRLIDVNKPFSQNLSFLKDIKLDNITIDLLGTYQLMKCQSIKPLSFFNPSNTFPLMVFILIWINIYYLDYKTFWTHTHNLFL